MPDGHDGHDIQSWPKTIPVLAGGGSVGVEVEVWDLVRFKGVSGTSKLKLKQFKRQSKLKQLMPHIKTKPRTHILVFFSKGNSVRRVGVV